ncbi:hypothetical protein ACS0TY_034089 [Phlomoides rotata]
MPLLENCWIFLHNEGKKKKALDIEEDGVLFFSRTNSHLMDYTNDGGRLGGTDSNDPPEIDDEEVDRNPIYPLFFFG